VFTANLMALEEVSALCSRAGMKQILLDSQESAKHTVSTDNRTAGLALARNLLASLAAARRPGRVYFVGGMVEHRITQHRLEGFKAALQAQGLRFSADQFIPTEFDAESAYRQIRTLFRTKRDVGGIFLNALPALEGVVQYFPEAPEQCRGVHYGLFDFHPIMSLLADLRIVIVKQNPARMMQKAYEILLSARDVEKGSTHYVPYEMVVTPAMRPFLPEPLAAPEAASAGRPAPPRAPARRPGAAGRAEPPGNSARDARSGGRGLRTGR
jgi:DNA-binding LacI/PurR family transcriptional regulator